MTEPGGARSLRARSPAKVIFNADDFGLTRAVNEGIAQAHAEGVLTAASLMAVGRAFDHAVRMARSLPALDIGLHLVLVQERPLLGSRVASLMRPSGCFHRNAFEFSRRWLLGRIAPAEVRLELLAQCERLLAAGVRFTHIDSHQHVHLLPGLFEIVAELGEHYGSLPIRLPREGGLSPWRSAARPIRCGQALLLTALCRWVARRPFPRPHGFAGFLDGGRLTPSRLGRLLTAIQPGETWEIMCHPGLRDPASPYGHWGYDWPGELEALLSPTIPELLSRRNIRRVTFRELRVPDAGP